MSDVFFSDLNELYQQEYIRQWEKEGNKKLLQAVENGDSIKVGDYLDAGTEELV